MPLEDALSQVREVRLPLIVERDKLTVEKMLKAKSSKLRGYRLLVVGEGIEKKQSDFAAEVAAMTKNAA